MFPKTSVLKTKTQNQLGMCFHSLLEVEKRKRLMGANTFKCSEAVSKQTLDNRKPAIKHGLRIKVSAKEKTEKWVQKRDKHEEKAYYGLPRNENSSGKAKEQRKRRSKHFTDLVRSDGKAFRLWGLEVGGRSNSHRRGSGRRGFRHDTYAKASTWCSPFGEANIPRNWELGETQSWSHSHEFGKGTLHTSSSKKKKNNLVMVFFVSLCVCWVNMVVFDWPMILHNWYWSRVGRFRSTRGKISIVDCPYKYILGFYFIFSIFWSTVVASCGQRVRRYFTLTFFSMVNGFFSNNKIKLKIYVTYAKKKNCHSKVVIDFRMIHKKLNY